MSKLRLQLDAEKIAESFGDLKHEVEQALTEAVKQASAMTYAKTLELAEEKLNSRFEKYTNALSYKELAPGLWVVELDESAMWIEEDVPAHSMIPDLLKNNPKISKDGKKYKVIPFDQAKGPSQSSQKTREITNMLKRELKARGIPYKKIETDASGSPRVGKLHTLNINSPRPTAKAKTPALFGVNIFQTKTKSGAIRRDIMTFRVAHEKHQAEGLWFHPGSEGEKIMDEAFEWIAQVFDTEILPSVLQKFS